MAEVSTLISQSSLLLPLSQTRIMSKIKAVPHLSIICGLRTARSCLPHPQITVPRNSMSSPQSIIKPLSHHRSRSWRAAFDIADVPGPVIEPVMADIAEPDLNLDLDSGSGGGFGEGGGDGGDYSGRGGGGGSGGNNSNNNGDDGDMGETDPDGGSNSGGKRGKALSMSQKLTLGYAALVGFGGLMGYLKSGSQKSLASGGISALLLYYVYTQLPTKPVLASSIGMGLSAVLLVVMGSRYKKSGKLFPAGVVSLVSFVMTGGYLHGIFRAAH